MPAFPTFVDLKVSRTEALIQFNLKWNGILTGREVTFLNVTYSGALAVKEMYHLPPVINLQNKSMLYVSAQAKEHIPMSCHVSLISSTYSYKCKLQQTRAQHGFVQIQMSVKQRLH